MGVIGNKVLDPMSFGNNMVEISRYDLSKYNLQILISALIGRKMKASYFLLSFALEVDHLDLLKTI